MKRFYQLLATCLGILVFLCSCAVLIGRAQPQQEFLPELHACNDTLCYMNIILGQTTQQEAEAIVRAVPGMKLDPASPTATSVTGLIRRMSIFPSATDIVQEIDLFPIPSSVRMSDVVAHWGKPCAVFSEDPSAIAFTYPGIELFASSRDWRLQANSVVTRIDLYVPMMPCDRLAKNATSRIWHGFRRYPQ